MASFWGSSAARVGRVILTGTEGACKRRCARNVLIALSNCVVAYDVRACLVRTS